MYARFSPLLRAKAELEPFWRKSWFARLITVLAIAAAAAAVAAYWVCRTDGSPGQVAAGSPSVRVTSVATTNGDYFRKCAPAVTCNPNDVYRSYNGSCNNLRHPNWGAALTPFYRLMNAEFDDGK